MPVPPTPPIPRYLGGSTPGLLDPTQSDRILSHRGATLTFATFDLHTASGGQNVQLSGEPGSNHSSRIVIETIPGSHQPSKWRFVPTARCADGVTEGNWPRFIDICGHYVICTEDQWDIYKLDPAYDCMVPVSPYVTVVRPKRTWQTSVPTANSTSAASVSSSSVDGDSPVPSSLSAAPGTSSVESDYDGFGAWSSVTADGASAISDGFARASAAAADEDPVCGVSGILGKDAKMFEAPKEPFKKRKGEESTTESGWATGKRRKVHADYAERQHVHTRRQHAERHNKFKLKQANHKSVRKGDTSGPSEDAARCEAGVQEARRKFAKPERDRPSWEHAAPVPEIQGRLQEEARGDQATGHSVAQMNLTTEDHATRLEAVRNAREERRREHLRQWPQSPWSETLALKRYSDLAETFDSMEFSNNSLMFETIPWPVLIPPSLICPANIHWAHVDAFFHAAEKALGQQYWSFLQESHRRFHPDRWAARRVLSYFDEDPVSRVEVEAAVNRVAQAITPRWSAHKQALSH